AGRDQARIDTAAGIVEASRAGDRLVTIDMGPPGLDWTDIPLAEEMDTRGIELQVGPIDAPHLHTPGAVSMGNPHVVFFTADEPDDQLVRGTGSLIEHHPLFPQGVNVGFAQVRAPDRIRLRVWERGAGLTRACGTGACAALVAAARRGKAGRSAVLELDGGELRIDWRESDDHVLMTGPLQVERTGFLPGARRSAAGARGCDGRGRRLGFRPISQSARRCPKPPPNRPPPTRKPWTSTACPPPARSPWPRPSRWPPSATCRWPIRPASPCRCARSPAIRT